MGKEAYIARTFFLDGAVSESLKLTRPSDGNETLQVSIKYSGMTITSFDETNGFISLELLEHKVRTRLYLCIICTYIPLPHCFQPSPHCKFLLKSRFLSVIDFIFIYFNSLADKCQSGFSWIYS